MVACEDPRGGSFVLLYCPCFISDLWTWRSSNLMSTIKDNVENTMNNDSAMWRCSLQVLLFLSANWKSESETI